jgi:glycosyltransferase involved in cell wall biosynthesis
MNLGDNIFLHGIVADMPEWLKDKHYVVCTSPWESQHMGVMEAMATGCMPLVHNFPGAKQIYPEEFVWTTIEEFVDKITTMPWSPSSFRKIVEDRFSLAFTNKQLDEIIDEISKTFYYGQEF